MVQEEIFSQLRLRSVNFCIQSYMFCISFIPFLPVWIQIRILNKNAQSCWITDPIFFYPDPQHCLQPLIITQNNHNFTLKSNRNWLHAHVGTPCRVTHPYSTCEMIWTACSAMGTYLSSILRRRMVLSVCERCMGWGWTGLHLCTTTPRMFSTGIQLFHALRPP